MQLKTPLSQVLRTTKDYVQILREMNLCTVEDLLLYFPRTHEDLSQLSILRSAPLDQKGTFQGTISNLKPLRTKRGKRLVTAKFADEEGLSAEVVWFNQPHIMRMLSEGEEVVLTGKLLRNGNRLQIQSPQFEREKQGADLVHAGRLVPVYPQHDRITSKWLREKLQLLRPAASLLPENLPEEVVREEGLISRSKAVEALHFPESGAEVEQARERLAFEEMYHVQERVLLEKQEYQGETQERLQIPMDADLIRMLFASLHFTPTNSQKIAIYEILKDMEKDVPMSRLLEGDVGSGKTLVATAVMANVIRRHGQCALMVPTEVLAKQHAASIGRMLVNFQKHLAALKEQGNAEVPQLPHPTVTYLTGSVSATERIKIETGLANGTIDLVIGTHALIEERVKFKDLKLVIIDEQHRFGVNQRKRLKQKGSPHFLAMTATPIPRTLALTAHGHHDLSVLLEKPGNRKPIHTKVVAPTDRPTIERFIDQEITQGRQAFVICPLITDSENEDMLEIRSVERETERLQEAFAHRRIAMLHGRLSPQEKQTIMEDFKAKKYDILVSTSVIEVGIDVPNATIICIEGSERFGLAQLHQFRGRVGRGEQKSHCFLFTTSPQQARSQRLKAMEQYDSGFQLAEIDLRLRGPGEIYGLRQSGIPEIRFGGLMNPELVVRARRAAEKALGLARSRKKEFAV